MRSGWRRRLNARRQELLVQCCPHFVNVHRPFQPLAVDEYRRRRIHANRSPSAIDAFIDVVRLGL